MKNKISLILKMVAVPYLNILPKESLLLIGSKNTTYSFSKKFFDSLDRQNFISFFIIFGPKFVRVPENLEFANVFGIVRSILDSAVYSSSVMCVSGRLKTGGGMTTVLTSPARTGRIDFSRV